MSQVEELFALHVKASKLPMPEREYRFCERRWKFDFCWTEIKLALEIEGGTWTGGRHTRGAGFEADCRKYAKALILGWRVLRVTSGMVQSGEALGLVEQAIKGVPE